MANTRVSSLELRLATRHRTNCTYWDYYIDNKRLADVLEIGDIISPLGWLDPDVEERFAAMLLRKRQSDLRPDRIPLFVCPECADYGCGVYTCRVERDGQLVTWRDFAMENDYEETMRQDDAERWQRYSFDVIEYYHVFERFMVNERLRAK